MIANLELQSNAAQIISGHFSARMPSWSLSIARKFVHRSSCELPPRAGGCFLHHIISRVQSRMMDKIDGRVPMANASNDQVYPTLIRGSCYLGSAFPVGFQGVFGPSTAVVRNYSLLRDSPDFICKTRWTDIFEKRGARLIGDLNTTLISMSSDYKTSQTVDHLYNTRDNPPMAPTSPSISRKVLVNAPSYRHIQASLADLRDAPLVFAYQRKRVKALESDLSQAAESVKKCAEATKKEREEHARIRDSTARKLAYKLTRRKEKYEEKATKEEKEYVSALNREIIERRRGEELAQTLKQAKTELDIVNRNMSQYTALKSELWTLYDRVFDGEGDRRDTELKHQIDIADETYRLLAKQASDDTQIARLLEEAQSKMKETRENMNKAVELTKWDINSNSAMSDQIKHNHLKAAHAAGDKAKSFVRDARKVSADVGEIREFTIPTGHMRMEVFYVNPVFQAPSDESVREAGQSVEAVYKTIEAEFLSATQRAARSRADLDEAANVVNDSRRNLEVYRQEVFDMVLLESQNDPLPLYSNIRQI